jgi:hypothetical protein
MLTKPRSYDLEPTRERLRFDRLNPKHLALIETQKELHDSITILRYKLLIAERRRARQKTRNARLITAITYMIYPFYVAYKRVVG